MTRSSSRATGRVGRWGSLPFELRLLLFSQFAFNVGFYLVVPFLASHLEDELHLAGWLIGVVLGLRTFSQQGLFVVGGAIADRLGIRFSILVGCAIRIVGFLTLAVARDLALVTIGVVLVGVAAALFSPATEAAITEMGGRLEAEAVRRGSDGPTRAEIVGLENMCAKLGSVVGPVLGGIMLVVPFWGTCAAAAMIFVFILLAHARWLHTSTDVRGPDLRESFSVVLRNRRFLTFAAIHSSYLLTYNMLYLALPVELQRIGAPPAAITWMFVLAAFVVVAAQLPVTRWTRVWSLRGRLLAGYLLLAACYLPIALTASTAPAAGWSRWTGAVLMVVLLHLGQVLVVPAGREVVASVAGERLLGTHLGALASVGGLAVLLGSTAFGGLLDLARMPGPRAWLPWAAMALVPLASAVAVGPFLSGGRAARRAGG